MTLAVGATTGSSGRFSSGGCSTPSMVTTRRSAVAARNLAAVREMLAIGRDHGRYEMIRIACMVVYGESTVAQAEEIDA